MGENGAVLDNRLLNFQKSTKFHLINPSNVLKGLIAVSVVNLLEQLFHQLS